MNALSNLGIDGWSLLLYLVNVGLLILVLGKFLYRPLLKYLDERRETVSRNIAEAEVLKKNFQEELEKQERKTQELINKLETEVVEARKHAAEKAKQIINGAEEEAEAILARATKQSEVIKQRIGEESEQEIIARMQKIIKTILRLKVPQNLVEESVSGAWEDLKKDLQKS